MVERKIIDRFNSFLNLSTIDIINKKDDYQNQMAEYLENNNFSKSLELVKKLKLDLKIEGGDEIVSFFETIASTPFSTEEYIREEVKNEKVEALTYKFIEGMPVKQIIKVDNNIDFEEAKRISEMIIGNKLINDESLVFPFIIADNFSKKGRIIQRISAKAPYNLIAINTKGELKHGNFKANYLDNPKSMYHYNSERYIEYLHTYIFQSEETNSEDNMEYTILSKDPIPVMEDVIITGMQIPINDKIKIGSNASINKGAEIIYLTKVDKMVNDISFDRFKIIIKKFKNNFDLLYSAFFGKFRHPKIFEQFLISWLFASECSYGPINSYKPNLGIIGPTRGGKSRILDCISKVFKESKESENTTIKSFVPNFGGTRPDAGRFLKTKRFIIAEEFLSKLHKSDGNVFDSLKSLLVHDTVNAGSGKFEGQTINGKPTSTMVFASNFIKPKITNLIELADALDPAILSRFIIYIQTKAHYDFVNDRKSELSKQKISSDNDFLPNYSFSKVELYDFLLKQKVDFNGFNEFDIFQLGKDYLPDDANVREMYNGGNEHLVRLIDGVTKKNYILESREGNFKVTQTDFDEAKDIWIYIINSWTGEISKLPKEQRLTFLTQKQRIVYDSILNTPGISKKDLNYIIEENASKVISELFKMSLIEFVSLSNSDNYNVIDDNKALLDKVQEGKYEA